MIAILLSPLVPPCAQSAPISSSGPGKGDAKKFGFERPLNLQWLPNDARQWARYDRSILVTDLRQATPASALTQGKREKGKWKVLPFETADFKGYALSIYGRTEPAPVRLPLTVSGWHAVYVGVCTVSGGLDAPQPNGLRAKLARASVYRRIANNLMLLPSRRDTIQEHFLTVAKLDPGESIDFAPMPYAPATVTHVRLVPISEPERAAWEKENSDPAFRSAIATFDGHSWIWPYRPRTREDLLENFEGFQGTDFRKWWFQILGADLVFYPSRLGTIPGAGTVDFSRWEHEEFTRSAEALIANGVNALKVARDVAREQGSEFHVMIRPQGWGASIPWEETFNSKFYHAHPEWRCVDREGR
ncbi:MAG: hypothetical protein M3463_23575 [Verrucomicrobiota bacterium]|nr:hypothetical protein [Verrucomicrobiota bacterium]